MLGFQKEPTQIGLRQAAAHPPVPRARFCPPRPPVKHQAFLVLLSGVLLASCVQFILLIKSFKTNPHYDSAFDELLKITLLAPQCFRKLCKEHYQLFGRGF